MFIDAQGNRTQNAIPDGTGKLILPDGRSYDGQWDKGTPVGDMQTRSGQFMRESIVAAILRKL